MIKIGDFSKISQVSVKTLRFYDEMGLLKPVEVDRFTGYRYYGFDQLPRLYRILALKDLGLSLEEIGKLLDQELPIAELRGMLRLKQHELRGRVQEEQARLERVETRLKQLEQETFMANYDVVIKKVEPILVLGARGIIPAYPEQDQLWRKLANYERGLGISFKEPCFTIYHTEEPEIDAEVCEPVEKLYPSSGGVQAHELPALEMAASVVHHGPFTTIGEAYQALIQWIQTNGYRVCGPCREIYLKPAATPGSQTDPNTVTEIQFPVMKA